MMKNLMTAAAVAWLCIASIGLQAKTEEVDKARSSLRDENTKAAALFDMLFDAELERSPEFKSYLGIKTDYDKWDNISLAREDDNHKFNQRQLLKLQTLELDKLNEQNILSYRLYENKLQREIDGYTWRHHNYPVNQMFGGHSHIASFLINIHKVDNESDALAYIGRLKGVDVYLDQLIEGLEKRKEEEIIAPKFVFPHVISDSENVISGRPFDKGESVKDSTLLADFKKKVDALSLDEQKQAELIANAEKALIEVVGPAYKKLIAYLATLEKVADTRDGAWKLPKGKQFYAHALQNTTTTALSAKEIHKIGLAEVERIHDEMRKIMKQVKFKGDLAEFFVFMREDKQFYYPETDEGRARYLAEATALIDTMKAQLDTLFITKPKADIIVKAVEPFREKSAGKAFYQRPSADGTRPGKYYANLYDMSSMPTYQMEALAYHEGIPGHHMQISIAQELDEVPRFRRYLSYTAYVEGWGLYSELVPKEIGFYQDPYSDFGRLAMELWRACRLVVDTGLHYKNWTRKEAIFYLIKNTPNSKPDSVKAIERYIVMPSQATAYKIGMLKILKLREQSKAALGDKYDVREFHDVILKNGAVPLDILEQLCRRVGRQQKERLSPLASKPLFVALVKSDSCE